MKKLLVLLPLLVLLCLVYPSVRQSLGLPSETTEAAPPPPPEETLTEDAPSAVDPPDRSETPPPAEPSEEKSVPAAADFVRVQDYIPAIQVELRYATENNFTGEIIYHFSDAYLRYGTVKKLVEAQDALSQAGYSLLIWDAFRPTDAQFALWEVCPDPVYVANPNRGFSSHSRGNTVDVTLVTSGGEAVEMPTDFDDFTARADRDYSDVEGEAADNALLLERVMRDSGFTPYQGEWWHFSDTDAYEVEEGFSPS